MQWTTTLGAVALAVLASPIALAQEQPVTVSVAIVDVQRIIIESAPGKKMQERLNSLGKAKQAELEQKSQEIADLRKRADEGRLSLAPEKLEELNQEIETKTIALRRAKDDASREFNAQQDKELAELEKTIMPVIQSLGEERSYTLMFRKFNSGLVYADDAVDVTDTVIERIDAQGKGG